MTASKLANPGEIVKFLKPGYRIFIHGAAATPIRFLDALREESSARLDLELLHLHLHGPVAWKNTKGIRDTSLFVGENLRGAINHNNIDYLPCFLSEIPSLFRKGIRKPDIAIVQVSPPDSSGHCSLGTSVDIARAAIDSASIVIAQINSNVPRTHGDGLFPFSKLHAVWEHEDKLLEGSLHKTSACDTTIAKNVAALIEDGSTLQIGVGALPDAILAELKGHRRLGIHTETFSDGLLPLLENGAVDNSEKHIHRGKTVTSFVSGSQKLYNFVHDNPSIVFLESDYVNRPYNIARNPKAVSINSAVEVDLTGQICADSIGPKIISGVGGQVDFFYGSTLSEGGKSILAISSRTRSGKPRIVPFLRAGAGVVSTRAHAHFIVTEYGVADLFGKTIGERAKALIRISHPEHRETLDQEWMEFLKKNGI